jgi:hypothetical protein
MMMGGLVEQAWDGVKWLNLVKTLLKFKFYYRISNCIIIWMI